MSDAVIIGSVVAILAVLALLSYIVYEFVFHNNPGVWLALWLLSLPRVTEDPVENSVKNPESIAVIVQPNDPPINNFLEQGNRSHLFLNLSGSNRVNLPVNIVKTLRSLAMIGASKRTKTQRFVPYNRIPSNIYTAHKDVLDPHIHRRNVTYKMGGSPIHNKRVLLGHYFNGATLQPEEWYNIRNPIPESNDEA